MPLTDAYHDFRPDPEWTPTSHLSKARVQDESARIPASAKTANGLLNGFTDWFVYGHGKPIYKPTGDGVPPTWDAMTPKAKADFIAAQDLPWLFGQMKTRFTDETHLDADPPVNGKKPMEEYRPYVRAMLVKLGKWGAVKQTFLEEPAAHGLTAAEGRKLMVGVLYFRRTYMWALIIALKDGGFGDKHGTAQRISAKCVGSAELTSDIDITVGGGDEVVAVVEANRYFRDEWGVEMATMLDTMIYYRDWLTVVDVINTANQKEAEVSDPSLQVQVLDPVGDVFGIIKVRRFLTAEQWEALVGAVKKDVTVSGLAGADIPMFKRWDEADTVFTKLFVEPILARLDTLTTKWGTDAAAAEYKRMFPECEREGLQKFEALCHYEKDTVVRAVNLAYAELAAKARDDEAWVKAQPQYRGSFRWLQNKNAKVVPFDAPLNLAGMMAFTERQSLLRSEMALFATEGYFTQGALWDVVGGQGGAVPVNINVFHYLQSFNEQIGDALKELQEYYHEACSLWRRDPSKQTEHELSEHVWAEMYTGYYRASKYENRMYEIVAKLDKLLRDLPEVKKRIQTYKELFPGKLSPDEMDLGNLGHEHAVAEFYEEHIAHLVAMRYLRKAYSLADMKKMAKMEKAAADAYKASATPAADYSRNSLEDNRRAAANLVFEAVKEGSAFNRTMRDPARDWGRMSWKDGSQWKPQTAFADDGKGGKAWDGKLGWGMLHLMDHLLTHCAIVNKVVRSILSRGPLDVTVRTYAT